MFINWLWNSKRLAIPDEFRQEFNEEIATLNSKAPRYLAFLLLVGSSLFVILRLDFLIGAEKINQLLILRFCLFLLGLISLAATYTQWGNKNPKLISFSILVITGWCINGMIRTLGYDSSYYAGLNFIYLAAYLVPWELKWTILSCALTYFAYLFPIFLFDLGHLDFTLFVNNNVFQIVTIFVAITTSFFQNRIRQIEILNRLTIKKQSAEIQRSEKAKRQFIGNVTHDLKTPLSIISGNIDRLQRTLSLSTEQQGYLDSVNDALTKSSQQLDMLIGVSLLDSPEEKPEFRLYEYNDFLRRMCQQFSAQAEKRGVRYHVVVADTRAVVSIDRSWVERIVGNLIQNAFKFTESGGMITVCTEKHDGAIFTEVMDSGCGISAEKIKNIFERKYQAHDDKKALGYGLGLSIVRELVTRMGGEISVESKVGEGTTFSFSIPLYHEQTAEVVNSADSAVVHDTGRIRFFQEQIDQDAVHQKLYADLGRFENQKPELPLVLVCEDTDGQLKLIIDCLREHYNLALARNGREGLAKLEVYGEKVSLILSDVKMPDMDGLEFCEAVFGQERYRHIPFIFLTAYYNEEEQLRGLRYGATDYLQKPFNETILREKVDHWITRREHERVLDSTIEGIQERNRQLMQLTEIIEHEIKNPLQTLNFIQSGISRLRKAHYEAADAESREDWDFIDQVQRSVEAIVSVLQTSRTLQTEMSASMVKPEPLMGVIRESLAQTEHLVKGIAVEVEEGIDSNLTVKCDRKMLSQVFVNLIRNAAEAIREKRGATEGRIVIRPTLTAESMLQVELVDNGVGIDREFLSELFKYRRTTKKDGTGIGLYLSRKILRLHGGEIMARPGAEGGATFVVTLPLAG